MLANLGLAVLTGAIMSASAAGGPPLAPQPDEAPAGVYQPAPPCSDALRLIASGLGGRLEDMRVTRSPTWGVIWRGRLRAPDLIGESERNVVCVWHTVTLDAAHQVGPTEIATRN